MIKKTFERVNEDIFYEKLDNGIDVYLYPTNKTKNFYMSISVKYGAKITKYKLNDKITEIIPGSAHFLEHKVMALSENKEISKRINELGALANAWTNYQGTNYNLFGSINLKESLILLLDIFYNININEEEKGIIGEEIDMYKDQINSLMYNHLFDNLFHNSYVKNTVVGNRSDIEKITAKELNKIYKDYYAPNNTFIIVTGSFDPEDIMNTIKEYMSKLNLHQNVLPKRIKEREKDSVKVSYEEIKKDSNNVRVKYAIKMKKNRFGIKKDSILSYYLNNILSNNISATSPLFEKYKTEVMVYSVSTSVNIIDDYVVIVISAMCKDGDLFIKNLEKDIKDLAITKSGFERKKKMFLKSYIMDFDNIEDVEYNICSSILLDNKVDYNEYSEINNMNYETAKKILDNFDFENVSIVKTVK